MASVDHLSDDLESLLAREKTDSDSGSRGAHLSIWQLWQPLADATDAPFSSSLTSDVLSTLFRRAFYSQDPSGPIRGSSPVLLLGTSLIQSRRQKAVVKPRRFALASAILLYPTQKKYRESVFIGVASSSPEQELLPRVLKTRRSGTDPRYPQRGLASRQIA